MKIGISIILCVIIFYGCSTSKMGDVADIKKGELKKRINENSSKIVSLEAAGNIAFDSPDNSGTGWIEVKIKRPDTVFVKIEGPFGISVATALITRSDFIYYNVQENKVITGPSTPLNIGAILRIKVSFDDLLDGLTGGIILESDSTDNDNANSSDNFYLVTKNKNESRYEYFVTPDIFLVSKYNVFDKQNSKIFEINYSKYSSESFTSGEAQLPNKIEMKNPSKKQSVYVDYIDKKINPNELNIKIKYPKSAKIIKWN